LEGLFFVPGAGTTVKLWLRRTTFIVLIAIEQKNFLANNFLFFDAKALCSSCSRRDRCDPKNGH